MERALSTEQMAADQNQRIAKAIERDQARLRNFIRKRVPDEEVEDILQEVFYELVEAYRMMKPLEQVTAWLFQVARNRIIDVFRKKRPGAPPHEVAGVTEEGNALQLEDLLPSPDAGPEAAYVLT